VTSDVYRSAMIDKAEKEADAEKNEDEDEAKKIDWSDMSAHNLEKTRALRKKLELQQKLKAKKAAEAPELSAEEKEAEANRKAEKAADAATEAIKKIELENKPKDQKADGEKVKLGKKMLINSEGHMTKTDQMRLQSAVGTGKTAKLKAYYQLENQQKEITEEDVKLDEVISFSKCKNCEYTITAGCTKIFVEHCEDLILRLQGKIITHTVEVDACQRMNLLVYTKIGTLQLERCEKINVMIEEKKLFRGGFMIWAGTNMLRFQVEDATINCDFDLMYKLDKTLNRERSQFKVWLNTQDKLGCDKVVRLENGFPTTRREDDDHERRKQTQLDELAKRMGVVVNRKKEDIGSRIKPNEKCPCGSGQKYKKCCLNGAVKLAAQASEAVAEAEKANQA